MKAYDKEFLRAHQEYVNKDFGNALLIYDSLFSKVSCTNLNLDFLKEYAICLRKDLRYEKSKKIAETILLKNPEDTEMLLNNCICLGKLDYHAEAIEFYEKILKIDDTYNTEIGYYAYLLGRIGKFDMADYYYKVAMKLEPENNWYISHYAYFLQKLKRYSEAEIYYKKGIEKDSNNSWLLKRYGYFICETKGGKFAYCYFRELIEKNASNYNHYINFAELAIVHDEQGIVFKLLSKADSLSKPKDVRIIVLFYWGVYYICIKDFETANNMIKQISLVRQMYFGFIHRDFTDLSLYIKNNCNRIQKDLYQAILEITTTGGRRDAIN